MDSIKPQSVNLTKRQKEVIMELRDGSFFITDEREALLCKDRSVKKINLRLFLNLIKKGLIFQNYDHQFEYELTDLGKEIKLI